MSAFLVTPGTIGAVARYAADERLKIYHHREPGSWPTGDPIDATTEEGRQAICTLLAAANIHSLAVRYPDTADEGAAAWTSAAWTISITPLCVQASRLRLDKIKPERLTEWTAPQKHINIYKLCGCIDYQSCEFPEWEDSPANRILRRVKDHAAVKAFEALYWPNASERGSRYQAAPWGL